MRFLKGTLLKQINPKLNPQWLKSRAKAKFGSAYYLLEDFNGREIGTYHAKDLKQLKYDESCRDVTFDSFSSNFPGFMESLKLLEVVMYIPN